MTAYLKAAAAILVAGLTAYGGYQVSIGVSNLYDDWRFLRLIRIETTRRQAEQAARPKPAPPPAVTAPQ